MRQRPHHIIFFPAFLSFHLERGSVVLLMKFHQPVLSKRNLFLLYFILQIFVGFGLLSIPMAWTGDIPLTGVDTLFTAVSAVCVTGLVTIDVTQFSLFGKIVLLYLIEAGGLGIITFSTLYLLFPGRKISLSNRSMIRAFASDAEEIGPRNIIRFVIAYTLLIEFLGTICLYICFSVSGIDNALGEAVFHSISAFCNAGFSTFDGGLEGFSGDLLVNIVVMALIIFGGLGFMVVWDCLMVLLKGRQQLQFHTKIMLFMTPVLILLGTGVYLLFEWNGAYEGVSAGKKILLGIFQSVTTRTAGFDTIPQGSLSLPSKVFSLMMMLIGAGSGSTGGGIKVTTFFILLLVVFRGIDRDGETVIFKRRLRNENVSHAGMFFVKAIVMIFIAILLLSFLENGVQGRSFEFIDIIFEVFSAMGTVGLSAGVTPLLSTAGKIVIILTMFAGRIGLFAMIIPSNRPDILRVVDYPEGEVLIG